MTDPNDLAPASGLGERIVEFAPWQTDVENDRLFLGRLCFEEGSPIVVLVREGVALDLPPSSPIDQSLEVDFISVEKCAVIRFGFTDVIAFRVLDESALLELWYASETSPRPARTTFRARGHRWNDESKLAFHQSRGDSPRFSYFVATEDRCLEVVCRDEPVVKNIGTARVTQA